MQLLIEAQILKPEIRISNVGLAKGDRSWGGPTCERRRKKRVSVSLSQPSLQFFELERKEMELKVRTMAMLGDEGAGRHSGGLTAVVRCQMGLGCLGCRVLAGSEWVWEEGLGSTMG
ncbi:hypothetical protein MRB53_002996 [Persea americana]|uniref:Uncharacterized protein n=1 Tax=Persea americana TaxID=3435 RepID=A0ACC2MWD9_PERAE|nr:hypothetical protein MRB53_002996 [Persea americana]